MIEIANIQSYFNEIDKKLAKAYDLANKARSKGFDPEKKTEIPLVKDMAERVEGLISIVAPQIIGKGIPERIKELEDKYNSLDWRVSLTIAVEIAQEKFCKFKDKHEAMEIAVRLGLAYITMGTVASPLEGFVTFKLKKRKDGKEYMALYFSGPIRSAGGTGASVCVLIADYVRFKMGYDPYDPTDEEIERMVSELYDYHERITNLQYLPSEEEIRFMVKHLPVQIDGDPSESIEVSRGKDLARIETNTIRNGVCLVLGEGLTQKSEKLWKQISKWGKDFELEHWFFLKEFVELKHNIHAKGKGDSGKKNNEEDDGKPKVLPNYTFIKDIVAGRPVLTHPLRSGGFRLRYGRTRTSGYSSYAINPYTMKILNKYIGIGTQIKVERPGKATSLTANDYIEGPVVKLDNGNVLYIKTEEDLKENLYKIKEILYLGDILINYGDFFNRAHPLIPPGYCEEWWIKEFEKAIIEIFGNFDKSNKEKAADFLDINIERLNLLLDDYFKTFPSVEESFKISKKLNIPLHPAYTFYWNEISIEQLKSLIDWISRRKYNSDEDNQKIILPYDKDARESSKRVLELLAIPHIVVNNEFVVINQNYSKALITSLNISGKSFIEEVFSSIKNFKGKSTIDFVNTISPVKIRDKSGIFIGARMGRPEKAKMRKLTGSPHVLFPVGEAGGKMRSFNAALAIGKVNAELPKYRCTSCNIDTIFSKCEICGEETKKLFYCRKCGFIDKEECIQHGKTEKYSNFDIDLNYYFQNIIKGLGIKVYPDLIKGVRGTSNKDHTPEHLAKGILRAKNSIYVNKDGTTRYDMTQLPITHFTPEEIGTPIETLIKLGYDIDCYGKKLEDDRQVLELRPQDVILPGNEPSFDEEGADQILLRTSNFVDELLVKFYGLKPFYNAKKPTDLIGQLVVALAPHTSAGMTCRLIGFSKTQGFFAHPYLHASTRRDCDGDEACVILLVDMLLNFSRKYLPAHRGSTQDAPLVLTAKLTPEEVDDMIFDMDIAWSYPLEFYEACLAGKKPWDIKIEMVSSRLNTDRKYGEFGFTHPLSNLNEGIRCSAYKTLPSMEEKLKGQMDLAEKIRAVDTSDVARLVIEKHFIKDTKGNLRKFSMQQFRCVNCNEKYRRPPLSGKCTACGGKIIFTISQGSVIKYLEPSISLATKYAVPPYLRQTLEILKRRVDAVFGREKEKQEGLDKWFG